MSDDIDRAANASLPGDPCPDLLGVFDVAAETCAEFHRVNGVFGVAGVKQVRSNVPKRTRSVAPAGDQQNRAVHGSMYYPKSAAVSRYRTIISTSANAAL